MLRQTRSVTEYITEFQTITSSLDWDEEALEDKFLEGLKDHVKCALIFFPTEPKNLEELFERAQKIDREYWSQKNTVVRRQDRATTKPARWSPSQYDRKSHEERSRRRCHYDRSESHLRRSAKERTLFYLRQRKDTSQKTVDRKDRYDRRKPKEKQEIQTSQFE